ncbi:MAG: DUF935 domain-containing protein, partial [Desulfovibrio sp.]|nr:DUF935 domain-containing protein [Desulfovibrio sp.]
PYELTSEIATRQNAGVIYAELEGWLNTLPDPDPVLRKRGDDAEVLRDLSADDQVVTAMLSRKNRDLNCPHFTLNAGALAGQEPTQEAKTLHERFLKDLENVNLRSVISAMLDAPFYGFVPLEINWRIDAGWWHIIDIVARPYYWFRFDANNKPVFTGAYGSYCAEPQALPDGKFVFVTHHATYDNPYGMRLLSRCLWPVSFKRGGLTFYARFVERHGLPWVIGEAPSQATAIEKRAMAKDLSAMVQDAVAVIPHGAKVTLEAAGQVQSEIHEKFLSRQDKAISKILMGQTLTVEMEGKNSQAAAQTHQDVAEGLADSDKAMVCDAWNEIAWLYAEVNAGADVLAPVALYDEPEDLNIQTDLDKKLAEIGVSFTEKHFTSVYGLQPGEFSVDGAFSPAEFAYPTARKMRMAERAQETLDKAIVSMLPKALKASGKFVSRVEKAVKSAESIEELEESLINLASPSMSPSAFEDFLACAMVAASGYGAASVNSEAKDAG